MSLHDDAIAELRAYVPGTPHQEQVRADCLAYVAVHPDALQRFCVPDHVTASALVVSRDASAVLLTLHGKAGRWFQTGGHVEDQDTSLAAAALREAGEESGLHDLVAIGSGPVLIDIHPAPCGVPGVRHHLDLQYVAVSAAAGRPSVSAESLDVQWFDAEALPDEVDASVRALVAAARHRVAAGGAAV